MGGGRGLVRGACVRACELGVGSWDCGGGGGGSGSAHCVLPDTQSGRALLNHSRQATDHDKDPPKSQVQS